MNFPETSNQSVAVNSKEKLELLLSIGAGQMIENTLNKIIYFQLTKYKETTETVKKELVQFEKRFRMTSEQFYRDFEDGKLGDDGDFFEWSGLYENVLLYTERIKKLETVLR